MDSWGAKLHHTFPLSVKNLHRGRWQVCQEVCGPGDRIEAVGERFSIIENHKINRLFNNEKFYGIIKFQWFNYWSIIVIKCWLSIPCGLSYLTICTREREESSERFSGGWGTFLGGHRYGVAYSYIQDKQVDTLFIQLFLYPAEMGLSVSIILHFLFTCFFYYFF